MIANALAMLVYKSSPLIKHPDAPVVYHHVTREGERWQIFVSRIPDEKKAVA